MGCVCVTCRFFGTEYGNLGNHETHLVSELSKFFFSQPVRTRHQNQIFQGGISHAITKTCSHQGPGVVPVMMLVPQTLMTQQVDGFELVTVQMLV